MFGIADEQLSVFLRDQTVFLSPAEEAVDDLSSAPEEQLIEGCVKLRLSRSKRIGTIRCKLVCDLQHESYSGVHHSTVWHRELVEVVNQTLEAGEHLFAFSFALPCDAPLSTSTRFGSVKWQIRASSVRGRRVVADTATPLKVIHRPSDPHEMLPQQTTVRVSGAAEHIGPYRFAVELDARVGGTFQFSLSLPSSCETVELHRIYARIEQTHEIDVDEVGNKGKSREVAQSSFNIFRHAAEEYAETWPTIGTDGGSYNVAGRLPMCRTEGRPVLEPTTPKASRSPLRVSHNLIVGLEFCPAPGEARLRLQGQKSIRLTSCELEAELPLPVYEREAPLVEPINSAVGCACHREVLVPACCDVEDLRYTAKC